MRHPAARMWSAVLTASLALHVPCAVRGGTKLTYDKLVPTIKTAGLRWAPPASGGESLLAISRRDADTVLQSIIDQSAECRAYVAAGGRMPVDAGATVDFVALPVLLSADEAEDQPDWSDWNRIGVTPAYFPGTKGGSIRAFISVQLFSNREAYLSYVPNSNNAYNFTQPPVTRVLTRPQMVRHWARLPRHRVSGIERDRIVWLTVGFSPKDFKLGQVSSNAASADETAYYLGSAYLLNPYGAVTAGWMTDDGKRFRPGFGVTLDLGIISAIFK